MKKSSSYKLHGRITLMLLVIAVTSSIVYFAFIVTIVNKLEHTMLAALVGHEIDELVTELALNPEAKMPSTASVNAYLLSRENSRPIPDFIKELGSDIYKDVRIGDRIYEVSIIDLADDRLYLTFDITAISKYQSLLLVLLIGAGVVSSIVLIVSGIWLSRKFLLPVSNLAEEVAGINPNDRNIRIEKKYRGYEVGLIAQSIDEFMARLDDFVEREQSFTAAVSHELRTPVSVIGTATDLLELKGIASGQQGAINRIKDSTSYMGKVIESLLFFARNTHELVEKTMPEIKFKVVFLKVLEQYEDQAKDKKLALQYKCKSSARVRMSENHLEIILGNLIRNAIVNTTQGEIKVALFENRLSVKDTGHGIEADHIELIVNRNYHSPDSPGCGLGLYLVKNICNIYGLALEIESTVGEGSEFTIIFPEIMVS